MAKKQTRRSISLPKVVVEVLRAHCEANELSMAEFVEHHVRAALGMPPRALHQARVYETSQPRDLKIELPGGRGAAPPRGALDLGERIALQRQRISSKEAVDAARRQREYEEAAWRNPCRRVGCKHIGLHPAHEDDVVSEGAPATDKTGGGDE